jgi:hypothetical protein
MNTAHMIDEAGFDVVEAANADDAIQVLAKPAWTLPSFLLMSKCRDQWTG